MGLALASLHFSPVGLTLASLHLSPAGLAPAPVHFSPVGLTPASWHVSISGKQIYMFSLFYCIFTDYYFILVDLLTFLTDCDYTLRCFKYISQFLIILCKSLNII